MLPMPWPTLPIEDLPAWARLNDVQFVDVKVTNTAGKGYGVVCDKDLNTTPDDATPDGPILLTIPHDLVLNGAAIDGYAKEDKHFKQLLDAVGHRVMEPPHNPQTPRCPSPACRVAFETDHVMY